MNLYTTRTKGIKLKYIKELHQQLRHHQLCHYQHYYHHLHHCHLYYHQLFLRVLNHSPVKEHILQSLQNPYDLMFITIGRNGVQGSDVDNATLDFQAANAIVVYPTIYKLKLTALKINLYFNL